MSQGGSATMLLIQQSLDNHNKDACRKVSLSANLYVFVFLFVFVFAFLFAFIFVFMFLFVFVCVCTDITLSRM